MVAPLVSELSLPPQTIIGGAYYLLDLELDAPTSYLNHMNQAYPTAYINFALWGNATAMASIEDYGFLWHTDGFTAAASNILSLTAQTARVRVEDSAGTAVTRYEVLSQMEDGLGLGVSGTPMVLTADTNHSIEVHTTSPDAAGIHCANRFYHANTVATTGGHWAMWVQNTVGAAGAGHGTMYVKLDCATFEAPTGGNSALNVEFVLPNCTHTGGSYHAFVIDVDAGGPALVMHGNAAIPCAFMKLEVYGTDKAQWETKASLLTLYGCDATEDGLWEATDIDDPDFTHTMRINIGGTYYYIGMSSSKAFDA